MPLGDPDVFCVLRVADERTAQLSRVLLEDQVGPSRLTVVRKAPFSLAVRATFEAGVAAGARWTVALDGDVLVRPGSIASLVAAAEAIDGEIFQLQGTLLDKPFRVARPGCPRLFATRHLPAALELLSDSEHTDRPESAVSFAMVARGPRSVQSEMVTGLHDFHQHYRDLFRKGAFHVRKHPRRMQYANAMWRRMARRDRDYEALLLGAEYGRDPRRAVTADVGVFDSEEIEDTLRGHRFCPKPPLVADVSIWGPDVETVIRRWSPPLEVRLWRARKRVAALVNRGRRS